MKQSRKRIKHLYNDNSFRHAARQYKDLAIAKEMRDDLKVMAHVILDRFDYTIKHSDEKTDFHVGGNEKKYHWFCYVKEHGYMFFGESEIDLYCNIIRSIVGNQLYVPFN